MKLGLIEVWERHGEELDFLIKADDDTFVIIDNLMARLQGRDPEVSFMMGHKMTNEVSLKYLNILFFVNIEELDIYCLRGLILFSPGIHLFERRPRLRDEQGRGQETGQGRPQPRGQPPLPGQGQAPQRGRGPRNGQLCPQAGHIPNLK